MASQMKSTYLELPVETMTCRLADDVKEKKKDRIKIKTNVMDFSKRNHIRNRISKRKYNGGESTEPIAHGGNV